MNKSFIGKTIGFIGSGNMAAAIIGGIVTAGLVEPSQVLASNPSTGKLDRLQESYGIRVTTDNIAVAKEADILFLSVKPGLFSTVIPQVKDFVKKDVIAVSIAAGQSIKNIETLFEREISVVRVMPNTPALVGCGMTGISANGFTSQDDLDLISAIFNSVGQSEIVPESLMDAVVGVSGSSPAYVYMFIEAMADAAVADGMTKEQALKFAAQSVLGAAKMVLETGVEPNELKNRVCSPGGTTIEAVAVLEKEGLRETVMHAQQACVKKSKDMTK